MKEKIREILENNGLNKSVDLINDLINKQFKPGWYWNGKSSMMYLKEEKTHCSFGFFPYFVKSIGFYSHNKVKATHDEVLGMFLNEAARRGIVSGVKVKSKNYPFSYLIASKIKYELTEDMLTFYVDGYELFKNGEWAEVVKDSNIEELYMDYLFNHEIMSLPDFIKQNKEKFSIALNNL